MMISAVVTSHWRLKCLNLWLRDETFNENKCKSLVADKWHCNHKLSIKCSTNNPPESDPHVKHRSIGQGLHMKSPKERITPKSNKMYFRTVLPEAAPKCSGMAGDLSMCLCVCWGRFTATNGMCKIWWKEEFWRCEDSKTVSLQQSQHWGTRGIATLRVARPLRGWDMPVCLSLLSLDRDK